MGAVTNLLQAGVGAVGTAAEIDAIKAQQEIEERSLRRQERQLLRQAEDVRRRGQTEALRKAQETRQLIGAQRAALAGQGILVGTGTAAELQTQAATIGAADQATIQINAFRQAQGFQIAASELQLQRELVGIAGRAQRRQTLVTGGLKFAQRLGKAKISRTPKRRRKPTQAELRTARSISRSASTGISGVSGFFRGGF